MTRAQNGQIMTMDEALLLEDKNGEAIKWVKNDDGTYFSELTVKQDKKAMGDTDKKPSEFKYYYTITPRPQVAQVSVVKEQLDRNIPLEIARRSMGLDPQDPDGPVHIAPLRVVPEKSKVKATTTTTKTKEEEAMDAEQLKKEQDKKAGKWIPEKEYEKLNKKPK